jgi:hypothetical protein
MSVVAGFLLDVIFSSDAIIEAYIPFLTFPYWYSLLRKFPRFVCANRHQNLATLIPELTSQDVRLTG